ncbi:hypothetical protein NQ315_003815 [Exocentrus adspersus]|uniref:Uncharacterized protein n=1 Tax=Exocentrus adspersus TaxID=1586481 RepID=A0AAV8VXX8_9CUCU|nr:hypothetical protein NQ315_003815 [Exocentrus adspersus]
MSKTVGDNSYDSGVDVSWKDNETDKISKEITNITHDHGNVASKEKNHSDNVSSAITNNTCTALDSSASCNDKNAKIEFSWGVTSNVDTHSHMIKDYLPTGKRSTSCTDTVKVNSTPNNDLEILIRLVEHDLKSELRTMMTNRRISLLLESEDYDYWHKCTKKEIRRLEKYISRDNLTKYMCYYFTCNIPEHMDFYSIEDLIVNKMKSNLKTLILKRGLTRTDTDKYLMYQEKIYLEWQRLLKEIPEDYVIFYTENISTDD